MLDPNKQRKIIVVHGVQVGDNDDLHQDDVIRDLFATRLGDLHVDVAVDLYKYEDMNNEVLDKLQKIVGQLAVTPAGQFLAPPIIDLVGDVVISLANNKTAEKIRRGLEEKIMGYYEAGHPCYIVAHSLGTVYAFDVINRLMKRDDVFDADNILTWPVCSWMSMGSPLGLNMFKATGRDKLSDLGDGNYSFRWRNYFDPNDPVVSGNIFGIQSNINQIAEEFKDARAEQGWSIEDYKINTGKLHLLAHIAYWELPVIGDAIVEMLVE
ncbi:MAG: hypothetical protein JKY87_07790 [Mariprofundus sp.]|nr:hypothetical protein [Mariprofundus sp.]